MPLNNSKFFTAFFIALFLEAFQVVSGQNVYKEFFPDDYPASVYTTRFTNYYLDSIKIKLIVVNSKKADDDATTFCRAWIKVVKNDSVINQVYFNNLDSSKNCTSLFLPEPQPSADFFMMVKYGDNDGRTIVIDKRGKIFNMIGGRYFITKDNRFLFSPWLSIQKGLAVFDFKTGRVVFNNPALGVELSDWYFQDGRYFSLDQESEIEEDSETDAESLNYALLQFPIRTFDFVGKQLKTEKLTFANLREENRLELRPVKKKKLECFCHDK